MSLKPHFSWKTVIQSESNMRDALNYFMDDYERLLDFYQAYNEENVDDATWVHVDAVREERIELEEKIDYLEERVAQLSEELAVYKNIKKLPTKTPTKSYEEYAPKKKLKKRTNRLTSNVNINPTEFKGIDDDDIPF